MSTPSEDPLRLTIVLTGFPPDVAREDAVARVRLAFGTDLATAERFVENIPVVVKRGATKETARAYVQTLHKIGAEVEVRREEPSQEAALQTSSGQSDSTNGARAAIGRLNTVSVSRQAARSQQTLQIPGQPASRPIRRTSPDPAEAAPNNPEARKGNPVETEFAAPPRATPHKAPPIDALVDRIDLDEFVAESDSNPWDDPVIEAEFVAATHSAPSDGAAVAAPLLDDLYSSLGSDPFGDVPAGGWDPSTDASEQHLDMLEAAKAAALARGSSAAMHTRLEAPPTPIVMQPAPSVKIFRSAEPAPRPPSANPLDELLIHNIDADDLPGRIVGADAGITVDGVWPPDEDEDGFVVEQNAISGDAAPSGVAGFEVERGVDDNQPSLESLLYDRDHGELQLLDPLALAGHGDTPPPLADDALDADDAAPRRSQRPRGRADNPLISDERGSPGPPAALDDAPALKGAEAPSAGPTTSPLPARSTPANPEPKAARPRGDGEAASEGSTGPLRPPPPRVLTPARGLPRPAAVAAPARAFWPTVPRAMLAPMLGAGILWLPIMAVLLTGVLLLSQGSGVMLAAAISLLMIAMVAQTSSFSRAATQALHGDLTAPKLGFDREDLLKGGVLMTIFALLFFALPIWVGSGLLATGDAARDVALATQDPSRTREWSPEEPFFDAQGARVLFLPNTPANVALTKEGKRVLVDPSRRQVDTNAAEKAGASQEAIEGFPVARFLLFLLLLTGALYCWPMTLTILSLGTRTSDIFNPLYLARAIKAGGGRYGFVAGMGIALVMTCVGIAIGMAASGALSLSLSAGLGAMLPGLAALLISALLIGYAFTAQGMLIGVMIAETPELFEDFHRGFVAGP